MRHHQRPGTGRLNGPVAVLFSTSAAFWWITYLHDPRFLYLAAAMLCTFSAAWFALAPRDGRR